MPAGPYGITGHLDTGLIYYNGFLFACASNVSVTQQPILDDAGMGTAYHEITVRLTAVVAPSSTTASSVYGTDTEMQNLRDLLSKPGGHFIIAQKGFGWRLEVNASMQGLRDVNFGPKPQILSWTPLGSNMAAEVEWSVVVCVPQCYVHPGRSSGVMSINFGVTFAIDNQGMTTRTIAGYYEIAMTHVAAAGFLAGYDRRLVDTADRYWNAIVTRFKPPIGFKRSVDRNLSNNKKRMEFTITDAEVPSNNPYPEGVTNITARHRVTWNRRKPLDYRNEFSASIGLRPGLNGFWAWAIFVQLVRQRMNNAIRHATDNWVMLEELSAEEDIFGYTHNFAACFRFLSKIEDFVRDSGLWQPIGTNWDRWAYSLNNDAMNARGYAKLQHRTADETIYDLCGGAMPAMARPGEHPPRWTMPPGRNILKNAKPPADRSWARYDMYLIPARDRSVSQQQPMGEPDNVQSSNQDSVFLFDDRQDQGSGSIIHETGPDEYSFVYSGVAERFGHEIPRPHLETIGGEPTTEVRSRFFPRILYDALGVKMFGLAWMIQYVVRNKPIGIK